MTFHVIDKGAIIENLVRTDLRLWREPSLSPNPQRTMYTGQVLLVPHKYMSVAAVQGYAQDFLPQHVLITLEV